MCSGIERNQWLWSKQVFSTLVCPIMLFSIIILCICKFICISIYHPGIFFPPHVKWTFTLPHFLCYLNKNAKFRDASARQHKLRPAFWMETMTLKFASSLFHRCIFSWSELILVRQSTSFPYKLQPAYLYCTSEAIWSYICRMTKGFAHLKQAFFFLISMHLCIGNFY